MHNSTQNRKTQKIHPFSSVFESSFFESRFYESIFFEFDVKTGTQKILRFRVWTQNSNSTRLKISSSKLALAYSRWYLFWPRPLGRKTKYEWRPPMLSVFFQCLFYVRPTEFWSLFMIRHVTGALIMTSIEYRVKNFWLFRESNLGSLGPESSAFIHSTKALTSCKMSVFQTYAGWAFQKDSPYLEAFNHQGPYSQTILCKLN